MNTLNTMKVFGVLLICVAIFCHLHFAAQYEQASDAFAVLCMAYNLAPTKAGVDLYWHNAHYGLVKDIFKWVTLTAGGVVLYLSFIMGKKCPTCRVRVMAKAHKCRYCGHEFSTKEISN